MLPCGTPNFLSAVYPSYSGILFPISNFLKAIDDLHDQMLYIIIKLLLRPREFLALRCPVTSINLLVHSLKHYIAFFLKLT